MSLEDSIKRLVELGREWGEFSRRAWGPSAVTYGDEDGMHITVSSNKEDSFVFWIFDRWTEVFSISYVPHPHVGFSCTNMDGFEDIITFTEELLEAEHKAYIERTEAQDKAAKQRRIDEVKSILVHLGALTPEGAWITDTSREDG